MFSAVNRVSACSPGSAEMAPFLRFVHVEFRIGPVRTRVTLGERTASRAGGGGEYLVAGEGADAELRPDPEGGWCKS